MNDEEELKKLYKDMYSAMIRKDLKALDEILSAEFVLIHMTGLHQNKKVYLESIQNGTLNYYSEKTDHISVICSGSHAEVTGQSRVSAAVFGSERSTWPLQQDLSAEKKNGTWKFTKSTASTY